MMDLTAIEISILAFSIGMVLLSYSFLIIKWMEKNDMEGWLDTKELE